MFDSIISSFNSFPDYIKGGIITLVVTIIAGIIVAYISTRVFQRISEVTRVKGILIERRIEIYKELAGKLENFNNLIYYHSNDISFISHPLQEVKADIDISKGIKVNEIFTSMQLMHQKFIDFDKYALENRIFYDDAVYDQILFLQNYLGLYSHIRIIYNEALQKLGLDYSSEENVKVGDKLLLTCGAILTDDFSNEILYSIDVIRKSMNEVSLKTRKSHQHTYEYYNSPAGPVMSKIEATGIRKKLITVTALATVYAAYAKINSSTSR